MAATSPPRLQAERVKLGIARTFQINRLFRGLSVLENVCMAVAERVGAAGSMFYPAGRRTDVIDEAMELLQTLKLADVARHRVSELPYGRQRLVELAITIGLKPEVLLLDEPAAGVPSAESHIILDAVEGLPSHIAVLIIEHDMDVVFRFAKRVTVMVAARFSPRGRRGRSRRTRRCARFISVSRRLPCLAPSKCAASRPATARPW